MKKFSDVIALWPRVTDLADDIGQDSNKIYLWKYRDSIPQMYWQGVVFAARTRGYTQVTTELLTSLAANKSNARIAPKYGIIPEEEEAATKQI